MAASNYQVFLTCNSEYHLQDRVCVRVRDRRTGRWLADHPALSRQSTPLRTPHLGESLEFDLDGEPLRTSPVLTIEERRRAILRALPHPVANQQHHDDPRVTR